MLLTVNKDKQQTWVVLHRWQRKHSPDW